MMKLVFLFCARFIFKRDDRGGIFFLKVCWLFSEHMTINHKSRS
jgi:hypothetical protein